MQRPHRGRAQQLGRDADLCRTAGRTLHQRETASGIHRPQDRNGAQRLLHSRSRIPGTVGRRALAKAGRGAHQPFVLQCHQHLRAQHAGMSPRHHHGRPHGRRLRTAFLVRTAQRMVGALLGLSDVRRRHATNRVRHRTRHQRVAHAGRHGTRQGHDDRNCQRFSETIIWAGREIFLSLQPSCRARGEIGRHARLRIWCSNA